MGFSEQRGSFAAAVEQSTRAQIKRAKETDAEAQERRRQENREAIAWCDKHVPELPTPYAVSSLHILRIGDQDVTAAMVRERVKAKHGHWMSEKP